MDILDVISLFGGLAVFLYGMRTMGDGLKQGSSGALKNALEKVTNNPVVAFLLGLVVTAVIQSSTATIVLTVGLVSAGVMSFRQSVGVVMGANVGTTVTAQIIRLLDVSGDGSVMMEIFKPASLSAIAALIAIVLIMFIKKSTAKNVGLILMGFAVLFMGLLNMTAAAEPFAESDVFARVCRSFAHIPPLGFLSGVIITAIVQSSSAAVGMLQAFAMSGGITFSASYALLLGMDIGTCVTTAIICCIGTPPEAKRTGIAHIVFNVIGCIVIALGVTVAHKAGWLDRIWDATMTSGSIANAHSLFKIIMAAILLPFTKQIEKITYRIVRDTGEGEVVNEDLKLLNEKLFSSPAVALSGAFKTLKSVWTMTSENVAKGFDMLVNYDAEIAAQIDGVEERIDRIVDKTDVYLVNLSAHTEQQKDLDKLNFYSQCLPEFERIADFAVNLCENGQELQERNRKFSDTAVSELNVLNHAITDIMALAALCFEKSDMGAARRVEPLEQVVDDLCYVLKQRHTERLRAGKCSVTAGIIFLNALYNIERIADHCSNIALYTLSLSDVSVMSRHHEYVEELHRGQDEFYNNEFAGQREKFFAMLPESAD